MTISNFRLFSTKDLRTCAFILKKGIQISDYETLLSHTRSTTENVIQNAAYPAATTVKTHFCCLKITNTQSKCTSVNSVLTSLTDRNSSRGKTRWRSKKWAILVVRSYSAIFAGTKRKRKYVSASDLADPSFFIRQIIYSTKIQNKNVQNEMHLPNV